MIGRPLTFRGAPNKTGDKTDTGQAKNERIMPEGIEMTPTASVSRDLRAPAKWGGFLFAPVSARASIWLFFFPEKDPA